MKEIKKRKLKKSDENYCKTLTESNQTTKHTMVEKEKKMHE